MTSITRTYVHKTPRPVGCALKSFLVYRVFGPGRTRQVDAGATLVEAETLMRDLAGGVPPTEPAAFVVVSKGKIYASVGLDFVLPAN